MSTAIAPRTNGAQGVLEAVICEGNLAKLQPAERVQWYKMRCESVGLDPRTQPFQYIVLNGKLTLYATKTATEQLCEKRHITTEIRGRERMDDLYIVTCRAQTAEGRFTDSIGAVSVSGLKAEALANALMKAETKAKRRAVLSLCGLGMLDENEVADIPGRVSMAPIYTPDELGVPVDGESGEVIEARAEAHGAQAETSQPEPTREPPDSPKATEERKARAKGLVSRGLVSRKDNGYEVSDGAIRDPHLYLVTRDSAGQIRCTCPEFADAPEVKCVHILAVKEFVLTQQQQETEEEKESASKLRERIYREFAKLEYSADDIAEYMRKNEQLHGGTVLEVMSLEQLRNVASGLEIK